MIKSENNDNNCVICDKLDEDKSFKIFENCQHNICYDCLNNKFKNCVGVICPKDNIGEIFMGSEIDSLYLSNKPRKTLIKVNETKELLELLNNKLEKCEIHNKELEIICKTDQIIVCSTCAIFGEHKGHEFQNFEDFFYNNNKTAEKLVSEIEDINIKFNEVTSEDYYNTLLSLIEIKHKELNTAIDNTKKLVITKVNNYFFNIKTKISEEINKQKEYIHNIKKDNDSLNDQLNIQEDKIKEMLNLIESNSLNELLKFNKENILNNNIFNKNKEISLKIRKIKDESYNIISKKIENIKIKNNNSKIDTIDDILRNIFDIKISKPKQNLKSTSNIIVSKRNLLEEDYEFIQKSILNNKIIDSDGSSRKSNITSKSKSFLNAKSIRKLNSTLKINENSNTKNNDNYFRFTTITNTNKKKQDFSKTFEKSLSHSKLEASDLSNCNKSKLKADEVLDYSYKDLFDKDILKILVKNKFKKVKHLLLKNNKITDFGLKNIFIKISDQNSIEYMDFSNNIITDLSLTFIKNNLEKFLKLKKINLKGNKLCVNNAKHKETYENIKAKHNVNILY